MSYSANDPSRLYRIAYEAFSKFANSISRCSDLEEVGQVSQRHLKYLLNFQFIRLSVEQEDRFLYFSLTGNKIWYDIRNKTQLLAYEKELFQKEIPLKNSQIPEELFQDHLQKNELINPVLWGWAFKRNDRKIIVSLISDDNKTFTAGDIDILKLTADAYEAKFHELYLKKQIARKNKSLSQALDTISIQNEKIRKIVENQQQIIDERTLEIRQKNEKLLQISALNAHNVREPLSRIQGIIQLFDAFDDKTCREELIPKLKVSAEEMDQVLQEVIQMATKELRELKVEGS